jgi:hypothetical protein
VGVTADRRSKTILYSLQVTVLDGGSSELDFATFLRRLIPRLPEYEGKPVSVTEEDGPADSTLWVDGTPAIVEVKVETPKTPERLRTVLDQLTEAAIAWRDEAGYSREPKLILAVPGILPHEH